jgi:hypothetical protein
LSDLFMLIAPSFVKDMVASWHQRLLFHLNVKPNPIVTAFLHHLCS